MNPVVIRCTLTFHLLFLIFYFENMALYQQIVPIENAAMANAVGIISTLRLTIAIANVAKAI